jgi:hypothetical protein
MMVDTSRNQWHIWLNLLLAMVSSFDELVGDEAQPHGRGDRFRLVLRAAVAGRRCGDDARGVPLVRLRAVPHRKEQGAASKRQQAVVKLAEWIFDRADGAKLTMPL